MDKTLLLSLGALLGLMLQPTSAAEPLGPFTGHADIGPPSTVGPGSASVDSAGAITVSGGGLNTWATTDAFHFVWVKLSGDVTLAADIALAPASDGADPHRKGFVMIRQSLEPDAPYADACVHGNGLTAIQWRDEKGAVTYETQSLANAPRRVRIEKHGSYLSMSFGSSDADLQPAGGASKIPITGEYYVGLGVCAHNSGRVETATFSNIVLERLAPSAAPPSRDASMLSTLETIQLASKDRRAVYVVEQPRLQRIEAPNWSADGLLYFNNGGKLFKIKADLPAATPPDLAAGSAAPQHIDLGSCTNINNDHAISPDGKWIAVSDQSGPVHKSTIYVAPMIGGAPRKVTEQTPSYFHGWSPDGKTLAYCGERNGNFDIYTISVDGGPEKRLTDSTGKDDGPEYSPDGQHIYFNSDRTGSMQIWRMKTDGSEQEQLTRDELNNWFPHVSPDGQQMVFLTYEKGVTDHPENKDVMLKLMNLRSGSISVLAKLFGGQGTINVPSWSPDGKTLAFVSYQITP